MSFLPGEKLSYAETHFKFKLPWSLLYRPWPEILVDAPFQFVPGIEPTLWVVVRDAHRFPTVIKKIEVEGKGECSFTKTFDLQIVALEQFEFHPLKLGPLKAGCYEIRCRIFAQRKAKDLEQGKLSASKIFNRWNYPFLKAEPLKIQVLSEELPKAPNFAAGEMHCHTHYSADHVEHGAAPFVLQQAAAAVGLDFVSCTDHAYDFAYTTEDYTKEAESPQPRFESLAKEIDVLNQGRHLLQPLMIAGEEVSAGNHKDENVHMTVLGPAEYLPGLGDCGRNWLENKPTRKIPSLLQMTKAHCFAAHPLQPMGMLEKFIFRRGYWSSADLNLKASHRIRGIQFWNGVRDEGFYLGRLWWIEELGKENYLLPIGGNDAHGDLNDSTGVHLPLFSLKYSREHVFGKVRTVVKLACNKARNEISLADINEAFNGDNCYITDGPALWWERHGTSVTFFCRSNADLGGGFRYIRIYGRRRLPNGKLSPKEELHLASQVAARPSTDITVDAKNYGYLRAEGETASGKFALTSAVSFPADFVF